MKNLFSRTSLVLACALSLSACGGGGASLQLGVQVAGVTKDGLTIKNVNNGEILPVPAGSSIVVFTKLLAPDDNFDIEVENLPVGSLCDWQYNKGRIGAYSLSNITLKCHNIARELSGTVTGLKGTGLVINNGSLQLPLTPSGAASQTFTFAVKNDKGEITGGAVGQGEPYGVTILHQPEGQTCTVANGIGTMGEGYSGVAVTCQ